MNAVLRQAPNILSALRLVAAPYAAWLILNQQDFTALCVFGFAALSDALDGFLAKKFNLSSRFGAWLDPAADKLLMVLSFITLTLVHAVPVWVTALVIGRDVAIVLGILVARLLSAPLHVAPLTVGKISTVVQALYVLMVLILLTINEPPPVIEKLGEAAVAILTGLSILAYGQIWLKAITRRVPQGDGTA